MTTGGTFSGDVFPWPTSSGPWAIKLGFAAVNGRVECVSVVVEPLAHTPSEALTRQVLRMIPLAKLINQVREEPGTDLRRLVGLARWSTLGELKQHGLGLLATTESAPRRGRHRLDETTIRKATQVYLDPRNGRAPTAAVARELNIARSTAAKYVRRARDMGLIAPTTPGRVSGAMAP